MEKFYNIDEAASLLGVSSATIYRYLKTKKIHAVKHGSHWRIPESQLKKRKVTRDEKVVELVSFLNKNNFSADQTAIILRAVNEIF